jgi:protein O-mannosyl-transferase
MKKKQIKKIQKQNKESRQTQIRTDRDEKGLKRLQAFLAMLIAIFAFTLYVQSVNHDYTLDDHKVIDQNSLTTTGLAGIPTILKTDYWYGSGNDELRGPIYRPTSLLLYAIVWEFSPNNPHAYHFINVLLYALTCLTLFSVLCKLFKQNLLLSLICTLFYAAHPIHTEVVNNIKSVDEILCFLFALLSIRSLLAYSSSKSIQFIIWGGVCFFLSLLSKETGVAFLLIIPLVLFFFSENFKKSILSVTILLISITICWLVIRAIVFRDLNQNIITATSPLNNTLYAAPDVSSRYATAFYILLRYVVLLLFPHPLTSDYNFAQIKIQDIGDPGAILGVIFYGAIGIYAILNFKKKNIITFGILFYLLSLAPVSNIFFLGGSSMAERFLYIPSLGFCLIIAYFIVKLSKAETNRASYTNFKVFFGTYTSVLSLAFAIMLLYSIKTFSRSKDWKDTLTIYSRDIQVSPNSATANELLGNSLIRRTATSTNHQNRLDTLNLAKQYLKRALEIAPGFFYASSNLGYVYLIENNADSAYIFLSEGVKHGPNDINLNNNLGSSLLILKRYDEAIKVFSHLLSLNPKFEAGYTNLTSAYLSKGDNNNALLYSLKLIAINPSNPKPYYQAGQIYRTQGDMQRAQEYFNKATSLGYKP